MFPHGAKVPYGTEAISTYLFYRIVASPHVLRITDSITKAKIVNKVIELTADKAY